MDKNKKQINSHKKKTTIRKQWTRRIMALIIGIFLVMGVGEYIFLQKLIENSMKMALPAITNVITNKLESKNLNDLSHISKESQIYKEIDNALEFMKNESRDFINKVYVVAKDSDEGWKYIFNKSDEYKAEYGDVFYPGKNEKLINEVLKERKFKVTSADHNLSNKTSSMTAYIPVKAANEDILLCVDFKAKEFMDMQLILTGILLAIFVIALIIVRLLVGRVAKRQAQSIELLVHKMREVSNLEGDLTQRINIDSNDEIGQLAEYTNNMIDTMQDMLLNVRNTSNKLNSTSEHFNKSFTNTVHGFEEMDLVTKDIAERISEQTNQLEETSTRISNINNAVAQVAENSQMVTEQAINTSDNAVEGNKVMEQLQVFTKEISLLVGETSKLVKHLAEKSEAINGIADTITAIAEQTNLLALNASIEAARAGEHGKGFAVVAENVRKLAEESSKSAEEIFTLIKEVQQGIENAGDSMKDVAEKTIKEEQFVTEVSSRFDKIVKSINDVSNKVEEVSSAAEEMSANTTMITEEMENLANISEENNASTEEVAASIDSQVYTIKTLNEMTKELNEVSLQLSQGLSKLKLE
jgi:methyl-accepting chemotaxis protein